MSARPWGTTRKLPSSRWQVRYYFGDERLTAPQTFPTKKAAEAWLRHKRIEIEHGEHIDPRLGRVTLSEYVEPWKKSSAVAELRASTKNRDLDYVRKLFPAMARKAGP
jgi:hypothetical protein